MSNRAVIEQKNPLYFDSQEYGFALLLSKHDKITLAYRSIRIEVQDVSRGNVTGPDEYHQDQTDL